MSKYLPTTFGIAVLVIASTALAEEGSAQKQFVNHNTFYDANANWECIRGCEHT